MRYIATEGFYGSGSSAVTDLISEYKVVTNPCESDFELAFFFGYDGIINLYFYFVVIKHFQEYAVRDFRWMAKRVAKFGRKMNYEKYFGGHFMDFTEKYLEEIQGDFFAIRHPALGYYHTGELKNFIFRVVNKITSLVNKITNPSKSDVRQVLIHVFNKAIPYYYNNITEDDFILATKKYINNLFSTVSSGCDIIMVDGLIYKYTLGIVEKFFDDLRVVLVDRDPRDIFISLKYIWMTGSIPTDDISNYCKWYRDSRTNFNIPPISKVKRIQFEDMIYRYEETTSKLESFLKLNSSDHIEKYKRFNPEISINNTRLWEKYPQEQENMEYIKNALPEWIYDFPT